MFSETNIIATISNAVLQKVEVKQRWDAKPACPSTDPPSNSGNLSKRFYLCLHAAHLLCLVHQRHGPTAACARYSCSC